MSIFPAIQTYTSQSRRNLKEMSTQKLANRAVQSRSLLNNGGQIQEAIGVSRAGSATFNKQVPTSNAECCLNLRYQYLAGSSVDLKRSNRDFFTFKKTSDTIHDKYENASSLAINLNQQVSYD